LHFFVVAQTAGKQEKNSGSSAYRRETSVIFLLLHKLQGNKKKIQEVVPVAGKHP